MKKIRNFNLSYVSRDAAQYDARLLDENDVVAARYRRYDGYECFILGKHTARNGVAGISPPRREFQKC